MIVKSLLPRVSAYLDGANLFRAGSNIGLRIDYLKLKYIIVKGRTLIDLNYYDSWEGRPSEISWFQLLRRFGYCTKLVKLHRYGSEPPQEKMIDTQIVADSIYDACKNKYDIAVFGSGDKDILPAIKYVMEMGKMVEIMAFWDALAWDLKNSGAHIVNLTKMANQIRRL
jgi:uncharacterized LabA/DUF88 family protein